MYTECRARIIAHGVPLEREYTVNHYDRRHVVIPHPNNYIQIAMDHGFEEIDPVTVTIANTECTPPQIDRYVIPMGISTTIQVTTLSNGPSALEVTHPNLEGSIEIVLAHKLVRR